MYCPNCQAALEANAKFCTNCGTKLDEENVAQASAGVGEQPTGTTHQSPDYVQQGKQISKQYWNFILQAMAHPFETSKKVGEADKVNGVITIGLFSLFVPLFSYIAIQSFSGGYAPPFVDFLVKPFFIFLIFFALLIGVKFGVAKLMKATDSFIAVMTRFGTLMVLPTATMTVAVLFAFLSIYNFSSILFMFAIIFASVASMTTIFSIKAKAPAASGGIDVYYGVVLTYVAMAIILLIIGDSILGNMLNELERSFYGIPF